VLTRCALIIPGGNNPWSNDPATRYGGLLDRSTFYGGDARGYTDYPTAEVASAA